LDEGWYLFNIVGEIFGIINFGGKYLEGGILGRNNFGGEYLR